jgi:hypothetical protein
MVQSPSWAAKHLLTPWCRVLLEQLNTYLLYGAESFLSSQTLTYSMVQSPSWAAKHLLTYSTVQSPSWAANWFAVSQVIPRISRNPKVHYRTHNRPLSTHSSNTYTFMFKYSVAFQFEPMYLYRYITIAVFSLFSSLPIIFSVPPSILWHCTVMAASYRLYLAICI